MDDEALRELRAEVRALRADVARLQAELAAATPPATAHPAPTRRPTPDDAAGDPPEPTRDGPDEQPVAGVAGLSRRRVLAGLAGAAGLGAGAAVVGSAATAGPAAAAPLSDGTTDLGEGVVDWSSANPAATLQLRNVGGGSPLVATGSSDRSPAVRVEQTNGVQPALAVRQTSRAGTAPALDVVGVNHGNAISAQGTVVGVFGVGSVYGVEGQSFAEGGVGMAAGGPKAALRLKPAGTSPTTRDLEYYGGEVVLDEEGTLWCCVAPGRPGTWREVASARSAGVLHLLDAPVRVYDSRTVDGAPLGDGQERVVGLGATVPTTAQAVSVGVTSTGASGPGFLTVFPSGTAWPGISSLNFSGADVTSMVVTRLGVAGITVRVVGERVTSHVTLDLLGWYG